MKITESMLRDYVETPLSAEDIGHLLTMSGFELEDIETVEGEKVLNVNIMANRGDGASVVGLAREVLAKDPTAKKTELYERAEVRFHSADEQDADCRALAHVTIETDRCSRYACRVFQDVKNGPSPAWLQERLRKIGQRPISLLVDLTNYVMFETGQPLHAFDLDKLSGNRIIVRQATNGERIFVTLDETERAITADDVMICDLDKPVAIAGIMGGLQSEVGVRTKRVLLESAHFDHVSVRNTRTRIGLATEASYRFERYVDPEQVVAALNRFTELYEEATSDWSLRGVVDEYPGQKEKTQIKLRMSRCDLLLGMTVPQEDAMRHLRRLGFEVIEELGALYCTPPTWRMDVVREEDLIEEVGRVHGYEKIPERLPCGETTRGGVFGQDAQIDRVREELLRCGLIQTLSHTLCGPHALDASGEKVRVRQPHSPETAELRNSLLPSVAEAVLKNGGEKLMMFETGKVFFKDREAHGLAIVLVGEGGDSPAGDFYTVKGVVSKATRSIGHEAEYAEPSDLDARFHPTRLASVFVGNTVCGTIGQIHPMIAEDCGLSARAVLAEIDLGALVGATVPDRHFKFVSKNPAVRRDIAVLISKDVPYRQLSASIAEACGDVLEKHWLFDVYEGKGIKEGHHSLAIALQLRKHGENFTDEEANLVRDQAVAALESLGATLR